MNRLQPLDPSTATGPTKEVFDAIQAKLGKVPNIFRLMTNSPAATKAYLAFSGALADGMLDAKVRELVAITVAEINVCEYCLSAHYAIGKSVGLSEDELTLGREQRSNDPKINAALRFVRAVVNHKAEIGDSDIAEVRAAGWNDGEIAELIANTCLNIYTNYFNHIAQPEVDFPKIKTAFPV